MITVKNKIAKRQNQIYADLHFHSTFSDGKFTPEFLADYLNKNNISIAALTDHDTINGFDEFQKYFQGIAITGVELSACFRNEDVHILGYGFDPKNEDILFNLNKYQNYRKKRIYTICEKLNGLKIKILPETIFNMVGSDTALGRPHVAQALINAGFVNSMREAFIEYIGYECPAYVPKEKMTLDQAIKLIHNADGIAILAHPGLYKNDYILEEIVTYPIDGIELYHSSNGKNMMSGILNIVEKFDLIVTGGSDFHQLNWQGKNLLGELGIDHDRWVELKNILIEKDTFIAKDIFNK